MKKAVRWMFLGCFLALAAIWCFGFAIFGAAAGAEGGTFILAMYVAGTILLPFLALASFGVGFFHREE